MTDPIDAPQVLSQAFIAAHPEQAAGLLEQHQPEASARLISSLATPVMDALIPCLLPRYAANLIQFLNHDNQLRLLRCASSSYIGAVLRYFSIRKRNSLLKLLPHSRQLTVNLLLSFAGESVGAWMDVQVVTIPVHCRIRDVSHYISMAGEIPVSDSVFVVDRNRRLLGSIGYGELMRVDPDTESRSLMHPVRKSLFGRMSVTRAAHHNDWTRFDVLPVVNSEFQFIGVLRHVNLRKGLEELGDSPYGSGSESTLSEFLDIYSNALSALFQSANAMIDSNSGESDDKPGSRPSRPRRQS